MPLSKLRNTADFLFTHKQIKFIPLNANLKTPLPLGPGPVSVLDANGGVGPFDFSGVVDTSAVEFVIQIQYGAPESKTIDVSTGVGSVIESAVTAAELAAAITAAAYTGITASVENLRITIDVDALWGRYLQVYGEGARIALFGQGVGQRFVLIDTQKSFSSDPVLKEAETFETTDTNNETTEVISDQYRKGFTATFTDSSLNYQLRAILEGGIISEDGKQYKVPSSSDKAIYFAIETVQRVYTYGSNKKQQLTGYILKKFFTAMASKGGETGGIEWQDQVYNIVGTEYKDPVTNVISGDSDEEKLTVAEFDALNWENI